MDAEEGPPLFSQMNVLRAWDTNSPNNDEWSTPLLAGRWVSAEAFHPATAEFELWNQTDRIILRELPRQPLHSIGAFMHATLNHTDVQALYPVGSSYASPFMSLDRIYQQVSFPPVMTGGSWMTKKYDGTTASMGTSFVDHAFLFNEALWDPYFFSTVPSQSEDDKAAGYSPGYDASLYPPHAAFDAGFVESLAPLPNPRMRYYFSPALGEDTDSFVERLRDYDGAAARLLVEGAFNVNSTSVEAWKAILGAYRQQAISLAGGNQTTRGDDALLSRFVLPGAGDGNIFQGLRRLSQGELNDLAQAIVQQVRLRGPFLSMADFVNRRLVDDPEFGKMGALQAALDGTVNAGSAFGAPVGFRSDSKAGNDYVSAGGEVMIKDDLLVPSQGAGLPGWLLQNDILKALGPMLTVRSDTFVIRTYGEVVDPITGRLLASSWIEAVVQRVPDYVNPEDPAEVPPWVHPLGPQNPSNYRPYPLQENPALGATNTRFGRAFKIKSIRAVEPRTEKL